MVETFEKLCEKIHKLCGSLAPSSEPLRIMEVCGTHTMAIARSGMRSILPENLELISGPGCPVCVTDQSYMDQAVALARGQCTGSAPIVATYGDMVRVPGRVGSLAEARGDGAHVEVVYSAEQGLELARKNPNRQVVFLAVGFETTAPAAALAVMQAREEAIDNFSVLTAHKLILPAMRALLENVDVKVDAFLCPGHVSVILGYAAFEPIVRDFHRPCVVAGFDPQQVLEGIAAICEQLERSEPKACTIYSAVKAHGNATALKLFDDVFTVADAPWRALGVIENSAMKLNDKYSEYDAAERFDLPEVESYEMPGCRCGEVITGQCRPLQCGLFGNKCTPRDPIGPCMVSSEGACAAAYKYSGIRKGSGLQNG